MMRRQARVATLCGAAVALCAVAPFAVRAQKSPRDVQRRAPARVDTSFTLARAASIVVSIGSGEVRVTGWARNEARIAGTGTGVSVSSTPRSVRLEADAGTTFEVRVPIGASVSVSSRSADIDVSGTRGELRLSSQTGDITASDGAGRTHVETAAGRVTLQRMTGETSVEVMTGPLRIDEIEGTLTITTISAPAKILRANLSSLNFDAAQGGIDFSGTLAASGVHRIETFGGNVELRFPADFGATIDLETLNGRLHAIDFPVTMRSLPHRERGVSSETQSFTLNGGGTLIRVSTLNGGVFLRKLSASRR